VLDYPFMEEKLRLYGKTLFYHDNLYKVLIKIPFKIERIDFPKSTGLF
jgi:hypothetical protein